jgi:hypothetical protein
MALCTLLALAARRRPGVLGLASYLCAPLVCELPFIFICYVIGSTALAVSEGAGASAASWVAYAVATLTVVALGLVAHRGLQAGPALDRALAKGLGSNWRAAIRPELAGRLRSGLPYLRILFGPFLVRRRDVEHVLNNHYGSERRQRLDVYRGHSQPPTNRVLVDSHGGAMFAGARIAKPGR